MVHKYCTSSQDGTMSSAPHTATLTISTEAYHFLVDMLAATVR